jgi:hypothetical protein
MRYFFMGCVLTSGLLGFGLGLRLAPGFDDGYKLGHRHGRIAEHLVHPQLEWQSDAEAGAGR